MPLIRMLAEDLYSLGSPGEPDEQGAIRFPVGAGNVEKLVLDFKGWLGLGDTLSVSSWTTDLTTASPTATDTQATIMLTIPAKPTPTWMWPEPQGYQVTHTATAASGRVRVSQFYLVA